ncbi:ABC transporter substrate-binding protein [Falsirhodobacter xinxiangensis]|uniref:ABC transporter substrate-binding protein n=1 Tax=Falsirhodobacter xinxiangensis TaxID=2530049 RepID=UPI0010A9E969|nr:sugar ABC transporter substrate-binding protein [Rhodobacter xinxiangensis]
MKISTTAIAAALAICAGTASAQTVAFLMPDQGSTRYDEHDYPGFQAELKTVCPDCTPIYQNANGDVALQQQQVNSAIAQGAKVIVLDPVDSGAAASLVQLAQSQDVKVIAYDRPIPGRPADFYISFDNEAIGKAIAESLVQHLQAEGVTAENGGVLLINGSPTDAAARLIRDGARAGIETGPYEMLAEYDTPNWEPPQAQQWAAGQITRFGDRIVGVVAANDGTAGGAVAAFKAAGVDPLPPVTGNDATTAALQLIIAGDQYNTISKPSEIVGAAAARVAAQFLNGETPEAKTTLYDTPSELFVPAIVTRDTLKAEIVDKGIASAADLCTGRYAEGCAELGIE